MSHRLGKKVLTIKERMLRIWKEYFDEMREIRLDKGKVSESGSAEVN